MSHSQVASWRPVIAAFVFAVALGCAFAASAAPPAKPAAPPAAAPASLLAASPAISPAAARADLKLLRPQTTISPPFGFFDDAFALSRDAARLALVATDGANRVEAYVVDARSGARLKQFDLSPFTLTPERLLWSSDGEKLLVLARELASGSRTAAVYSLRDGKLLRRLGPLDGVATTEVGGAPCFVTLEIRRIHGRATQVSVTALDDRGLEVRGKHVYVVDERGFLRGPDVKILYWKDAFTRLSGLQPGAYDAQKDIRKPDQVTVVDALSGKLLEAHERGDLVAFAKRMQLREAHPNQSWFVHPSDDLTKLRVLRRDDRSADVALVEPLRRYDAASLQQLLLQRDGALLFSLAVDPLNPDAVAQQRRDPEMVDLYLLRDTEDEPHHVGRIARDGRPLTWTTTATADRLVALRKHKGFDRGGPQLEIYRLALDKLSLDKPAGPATGAAGAAGPAQAR